MLLKEIKKIYHKELDALYPKEEVNSFFYMLIENYLGLERFVLAIQPNLTVSKGEEQPLFEALSQLKLHRPIQYIIGKTHFMDMVFKVDANVLIPRPETEELVRWIIDDVRGARFKVQSDAEKFKILDIGTGSGCMAISLAENLPMASVFALDISEEALEVAEKNALHNSVEVEFIKADILTLEHLECDFDIMVSNPPYVRELEKKGIHPNVIAHEPSSALFVPDKRPLLFYELIVRFAKRNLKTNGVLFLEINQYLALETRQLLEQENFADIELRKDVFGNDRMLKGKVPNLSAREL